ncbi:aromatic-ring-hydroxylating dioxygenase subunit beta [Noviherbaspirillum sp. CPCC 100848]|jgi:3-phenylpropionate/cinnamic acid dioxygenase small subunit|uniref:Aromatic-ring-hydroxylating dioxygenase subunit beta n=1 Tax=Noviherbaspirillum album TaxID=3080276 RepID=A0ABU6J9N1_9BURK|nr:aromatic-ring-hydroxylating dioxygenase subunit beta [Noviherbaspirillum sp. CPCC 100848]MEC4720361.1 aromatic-ring-hydroxylating dioxygenase subunit beta [Noviherbaspirillum sp. CPCC 100848]
MKPSDLLFSISLLNSQYAHTIDTDHLEEWPDYFTDDCLYTITSFDNHAKGLETGIVYCDSKGMLKDRVSGLREANIYEEHRYRHLVMMPTRAEAVDGVAKSETPFAVYRIMRDGRTSLFVTGFYQDEFRTGSDGTLRIAKRIVVCDSSVFDTLLAIPL